MFPVPTAALRVALVPSKQTESIAADRDTERQDGGKDDGIMTAVEAARHSLHMSVR